MHRWWTEFKLLLGSEETEKVTKEKQTRACGETEQRNMGWGTYLTALYFLLLSGWAVIEYFRLFHYAFSAEDFIIEGKIMVNHTNSGLYIDLIPSLFSCIQTSLFYRNLHCILNHQDNERKLIYFEHLASWVAWWKQIVCIRSVSFKTGIGYLIQKRFLRDLSKMSQTNCLESCLWGAGNAVLNCWLNGQSAV